MYKGLSVIAFVYAYLWSFATAWILRLEERLNINEKTPSSFLERGNSDRSNYPQSDFYPAHIKNTVIIGEDGSQHCPSAYFSRRLWSKFFSLLPSPPLFLKPLCFIKAMQNIQFFKRRPSKSWLRIHRLVTEKRKMKRTSLTINKHSHACCIQLIALHQYPCDCFI